MNNEHAQQNDQIERTKQYSDTLQAIEEKRNQEYFDTLRALLTVAETCKIFDEEWSSSNLDFKEQLAKQMVAVSQKLIDGSKNIPFQSLAKECLARGLCIQAATVSARTVRNPFTRRTSFREIHTLLEQAIACAYHWDRVHLEAGKVALRHREFGVARRWFADSIHKLSTYGGFVGEDVAVLIRESMSGLGAALLHECNAGKMAIDQMRGLD